MERRHDLGISGPARTQFPSRGQRVPTASPSTQQHAHGVIPRKPQVSGSRMTVPSDVGNSKERRVSLRATRNKLIVLAALLGLWLVIALGRSPSPAPPHEAAGSAVVKEVRGLATKSGEVPRLKAALITRHEPYVPAAVSLFSVPPPPPPPTVVAAQPAVPPPPSPPPPDPFLEAAKQLRFVGFLKSDRGTAAIVTQGTQLYIASRGDTVAERFRVASVHEDTVTLVSPEGDKHVRLALAAAAGAGASPVAMANPSVEGGRAEGESAGEVAARSEPATAKPKPFAGPVIRSRTERSEMYRVRAQTVQQ
jgi:hypothetical protein